MNQEPITVTYSLEEILTRIEGKIDHLEQKVEDKIDRLEQKVDERLGKLEVGVARLDEKLDRVSKRLENQEFITRGILVGLILAVLAGLAKLFGIVGNP